MDHKKNPKNLLVTIAFQIRSNSKRSHLTTIDGMTMYHLG